MKLSLRLLISAVLISLMLLVVIARETGTAAVEQRSCETLSKVFKGMCWISNNCAIICREFEHFQGGYCRGFRHRCYCTKPCQPGSSS